MSDPSTPDLGNLLGMAMEMQAQLANAQQQAANALVEGQAGGGAVRIQATGGLEFQSVTIDPALVDPDDVETLQDTILAALLDTVARANDLQAQAMGPFGALAGGGIGDMLSGDVLDLGSLLGGGLPGLGVGDDEDDLDDDDEDGEGPDEPTGAGR